MGQQSNRIVIHSGELVFGRGKKSLYTLLGSCVAIAVWHPKLKIGGMCHFALPRRPRHLPGKPDARYCDDCIRLFRQICEQRGTHFDEFEAYIYGGGNMQKRRWSLPGDEYANVEYSPIGDANASQAFSLLLAEGVKIIEADVGEQGYRKVDFNATQGRAQVEFVPIK